MQKTTFKSQNHGQWSLNSTSLAPKIMIVDDEEDILEVIAMTLEECGYTVEQFSSPQAALQKFKERPEAFQ